jgi:hypothetical protein
MSTSNLRRKEKSSRKRTEERPRGFAISSFSNRVYQKIVRDVAAGRISKENLYTNVTIGRGKSRPMPDANQKPSRGIFSKLGGIFGAKEPK